MISLSGFENDACVPTVGFEYPEDGDEEPVAMRDQWSNAPLYQKCQRRFAVVPHDPDVVFPMLNKRVELLREAITDAVKRMDFDAVGKLSGKVRETAARIEAEELRYGKPGGSERHGDTVIVDDAARGKVVLHFAKALSAQNRRWVRVCGFTSTGDGATFWRLRTFRRGENIAMGAARLCVKQMVKEAA